VREAADATGLRVAQAKIRASVERDLARMWQRVWSASGGDQYAVRDAFLRLTPGLVERYGDMAATYAADWYERQRQAAQVSGSFSARLQPSPYLDSVEQTVQRVSGDLWTETPEAMLHSLQVTVGKYVLAAGRQTIVHASAEDPRASGWRRVTRVGSCKFCRMLAGRGAVYKHETAFFASHGDCNCAAVPSWDPDAPEVDVRLYQASRRTSAMTPAQKRQHNALISNFLAQMSED